MWRFIVALCAFAPATHGFAPPPTVAKAPPRSLTVTAGAAAAADPAVIAAAVAVAGGIGFAVKQNKAKAGDKAGLAWDDNAKWLAKCKGGVVSWYDAGLRLTEPPKPASDGLAEPPKPAPAPAARSPAPAPKRGIFAPKRRVASKPGDCKPAWSGDAYGRSSWPEPEIAAVAMPAASKPAMEMPTRRAWSGSMYEAVGRVEAPPTPEELQKAKRMAAVAKLLAKSTIPRAPLARPTRRAYSGPAYPKGKATQRKRDSIKELFGKTSARFGRRSPVRSPRLSLTLSPFTTGGMFKGSP